MMHIHILLEALQRNIMVIKGKWNGAFYGSSVTLSCPAAAPTFRPDLIC
jgi:hypothetical protein